MEMIRHGQENVAIADRLHRYTRAVMLTTDAAELPQVVTEQLMHQFMIPQAGIRLWGVAPAYAALPFAEGVSGDARSFAGSLTLPYCGMNSGFEAANWLEEPDAAASIAMIPLRHGATSEAFGLLVLASSDATRFSSDMGTDFLVRIGDIASAGLSRLTSAD
jgi:uncharacterized protein YigA (DUF484 family)